MTVQPGSSLTLETLLDAMAHDFKVKFDGKLAYSEGEKTKVLAKARDYNLMKFRAMWNIYLADKREADFGISLEKFIEPSRLNKYAVKLKYQAPEREPVAKGDLPRYFCENAELPGFHHIRIGDGQNGWPERCPDCGGAFLTVAEWHIRRYGSYDTTPATREDIAAARKGILGGQVGKRSKGKTLGDLEGNADALKSGSGSIGEHHRGSPTPVGEDKGGERQFGGSDTAVGVESGDNDLGADLDLDLDDLEGEEDFF